MSNNSEQIMKKIELQFRTNYEKKIAQKFRKVMKR